MAFSFSDTERVESNYTSDPDLVTMAIWTYRTGIGGGGYGEFMTKGVDGVTPRQLYYNNGSGVMQFVTHWTTTYGNWTWTAPSANQWVHILVTYDGTSVDNGPLMYYNGVYQSEYDYQAQPTGTPRLTNADKYFLGQLAGSLGAYEWHGSLAEFAVWKRILPPSEIAGLGKGYSPIFYNENLVEYVPCIRTAESRIIPGALTTNSLTVSPHPPMIYPTPPSIMLEVTAITYTKSTSLDVELYNMVGWAWGQQDTTNVEIPEIWDKWKIAGGDPAMFDSSWGNLQLGGGDTYYSDVRDFGDATAKTLEITVDKYGSGTGTQGDIYWRGHADSFNWDAETPSWEEYTGATSKEWRYIQVRVSK
jgi:hypothetical protein